MGLTDQDRSTPAAHKQRVFDSDGRDCSCGHATSFSLPVEAEQLAPLLRGFGYLVVEEQIAIVDLRTRKVELVFSAVRQITGRINVSWSFERSLSLSQRRVALERGEYHSRLMRMF